jgi:hypothetical protein
MGQAKCQTGLNPSKEGWKTDEELVFLIKPLKIHDARNVSANQSVMGKIKTNINYDYLENP